MSIANGKKPITVLMTGGGAPGGAGVIRCLQADPRIQLHVGDAKNNAIGRYLCAQFVQLPLATDADFVPFVLDYCVQNGVQVVFPLVTLELFQFSEHLSAFEAKGIKVIVSERQSLDIANNKSRLCEHLAANGILTPAFKVVQAGDYDGFLRAFADLGYPERPLAIKPSVSNGSRGVRIVDNSVDKFDLLFNQKPNSLNITFEELSNILRGRPFPELLVSEVLPFEEYTVDTIVQDGEPVLILPRVRHKMNGGISVEGQFVENQEIIDYCKQIIRSMNLSGPIGIQVKKGSDHKYKILEINPRIQGTSVAAMGLGINLPLIAVYQALGEAIDIPPVAWDLCFSRYWQEVYYRL